MNNKGLDLEAVSARFASGFPGVVGLRFMEWEEGRVVVGLRIETKHLNLGGTVHGGVLATLIDIAGACAGTYSPDPKVVRKALTLSMTSTFTGQCTGGVIRAVGTLRGAGRRIYFSTVEILDDQDNLIAMGEGTFRYRSEPTE
ncbi:MAG TPA: PaaI family thioesterase [Alcanivoracaceae bacterium]|nr:PaaI family thioesterase [Alcanivoracaceae bacterium]